MEKAEIKFTEEEWKYFYLIEKIPANLKYTVKDLAGQTGDSVRAARKHLTELTQKGYLTPRTFQITDEGERVYQKHLRWWNGMIWLLKSWGLPEDQFRPLADKLLCGTTEQFVEHVMEQNDIAQMKELPSADREWIENTDFYGQLEAGIYSEGVCFWDRGDRQGYFLKASPVSRYFSPQAELTIELEKSRLTLHWISSEARLTGISYYMIGRDRFKQPEGQSISLPVMAFSFTRVTRYRMLEGKLDVIVAVQTSDEDGGTVNKEYPVRIELPMIFSRADEITKKEVEHEHKENEDRRK